MSDRGWWVDGRTGEPVYSEGDEPNVIDLAELDRIRTERRERREAEREARRRRQQAPEAPEAVQVASVSIADRLRALLARVRGGDVAAEYELRQAIAEARRTRPR